MSWGRRGRASAALMVAALLAGCAAAPAPAVVGGADTFTYVALGDSWAAGPLMSFPVGEPLFCARSSNNYPAQLAALIAADRFVDVTCGSAETEDVTRPQEVDPLDLGLDLGTAPPQADALTAETDLVTVTMGGNDIGLPKFALRCANLIAVPLGPAPFGRPCVDELTAGGIDQVSDAIDEAHPKVVEMLREVRRRAPSAKVYVVGYPAGLPQGGVGCWGRWPILDVDAGFIDAKMQEMNAMLAAAAQQARVRFVDTYTSSLGHDACKPASQAWVNGISFDPDGIPLHPNSRSAANTARVVAATVQRDGAR